MDYFQLIKERRSIRAFLEEPVEKNLIKTLLDAANSAPSAGNQQGYEIFLVEDMVRRGRLAGAIPNMEFFITAPVSFVFCANPERSAVRYGERGRALYALQDATIACTYMMLAATALGLGCVWVGAFREEAVIAALDIPSGWIPVAILPVGKPAEVPEPRQRRPLESIVHIIR